MHPVLNLIHRYGESGRIAAETMRAETMTDELDPETTGAIRKMAKNARRHSVVIDYTNHRGERSERTILPSGIYFGTTEWHPGPQWLLDAFDRDKGDNRTFAMKDIHGWRDVVPEVPS